MKYRRFAPLLWPLGVVLLIGLLARMHQVAGSGSAEIVMILGFIFTVSVSSVLALAKASSVEG